MFPRAASFGVAIAMFGSIFKGGGNFSGEIFALGLDAADFVILLGGCVIWSIISYRQEKGIKIREDISRKPLALRWPAVSGSLCGCCDTGRLRTGLRCRRLYIQRVLICKRAAWKSVAYCHTDFLDKMMELRAQYD